MGNLALVSDENLNMMKNRLFQRSSCHYGFFWQMGQFWTHIDC